MKNVYMIAALFFLGASHAQANVCSNLSTLTQTQGVYNDGTGTARSFEQPELLRNEMLDLYETHVQDYFEKVLTEPAYREYQRMAVAAFIEDCGSRCQKMLNTGVLHGKVLEEARHGLVKLFFKELVFISDPGTKASRRSVIPTEKEKNIKNLASHGLFKNFIISIKRKAYKHYDIAAYASRPQEVFQQVKPIVMDIVQKYIPSAIHREQMLKRISEITLMPSQCESPACTMEMKKFVYDHPINEDMSRSFAYLYDHQKILYCDWSLASNNSMFHLVHVIAHEMAHAIGPCTIMYKRSQDSDFFFEERTNPTKAAKEFPIPDIIQCLRAEQSVGARRSEYEVSFLEPGPSPFCSQEGNVDADHIEEAFADWVAIEALAAYGEKYWRHLTTEQFINGYANIFRGQNFEEDKAANHPDEAPYPHPSVVGRIDRLLLAHPTIRKNMGCPVQKEGLWHCTQDFHPSQANYPETFIVSEPE
jgi:hypothetical protein